MSESRRNKCLPLELINETIISPCSTNQNYFGQHSTDKDGIEVNLSYSTETSDLESLPRQWLVLLLGS